MARVGVAFFSVETPVVVSVFISVLLLFPEEELLSLLSSSFFFLSLSFPVPTSSMGLVAALETFSVTLSSAFYFVLSAILFKICASARLTTTSTSARKSIFFILQKFSIEKLRHCPNPAILQTGN